MFYDIALEKETLENQSYRRVIFSVPPIKAKYDGAVAHPSGMQLVLMSLKQFEQVDMEIHEKSDQFVRVEKGKLKVVVFGPSRAMDGAIGSGDVILGDGDAIIIPKYTVHTLIALEETKLYTLYSSNEHAPSEEEVVKTVL
jgi:mannose-6-phosphate isomerase-like protein (cupin superfamily)